MNRVALTHRGWFGLCPVYVGDINSDEPFIDPPPLVAGLAFLVKRVHVWARVCLRRAHGRRAAWIPLEWPGAHGSAEMD